MLNHTISWSKTLKYTFFITIIFVLEVVLSSIPNVQVTTVLMLILAQKINNIKEYTFYTTIYMILQGLMWGFSFYILPMYIGWVLWGVISIEIKDWGVEYQGMVGFAFAFIYGLLFFPLTYLIYDVPFIPYLLADIPYSFIFGVSNALTIMWLRNILYKRIPL